MNRTWTAPVVADRRTFDPAEVFAAGLRNHHIANTAYPIAHNETWGPYRVRRAGMDAAAARAWEGINALGLYVHIPFCKTQRTQRHGTRMCRDVEYVASCKTR